jgi:hypothetical protein
MERTGPVLTHNRTLSKNMINRINFSENSLNFLRIETRAHMLVEH